MGSSHDEKGLLMVKRLFYLVSNPFLLANDGWERTGCQFVRQFKLRRPCW